MRNKDVATVRQLLNHARYEVLPTATVEAKVLASVPTSVPVTVTASPSMGLEQTISTAERLAAAGYTVVPHLAARMVSGRAELAELAARLGEAGITTIFVPAGTPTRSVTTRTRSRCWRTSPRSGTRSPRSG